jgi:hypothetical protein
MPRKKGAGVKHPEKAHLTLTAEEARSLSFGDRFWA